MLQSTINCLRRVRFGTAQWEQDAARLLRTTSQQAFPNAAPFFKDNQAPSRAQLDKAEKVAREVTTQRGPANIVRATKTVLSSASIAEVSAMREAMLRVDYFPSKWGTDGQLSGEGAAVLQVPAVGSWSGMSHQVQTASGKASLPAEANVGDRLLMLLQLAPGVPLVDQVGLVAMDEVTNKFDEDGAAGFSLVTTGLHDEIGSHTAVLRWKQVDGGAKEPDVSQSADEINSALPGATDPVRDSVYHARRGNAQVDDGTRYAVELDILAATNFQPHLAVNPIAVYLSSTLAKRAHSLSVAHLRAIGKSRQPIGHQTQSATEEVPSETATVAA